MQANIFVLDHDPAGLELARHIQVLGQIQRWRFQVGAQQWLVLIGGEADAVHGADVHTGITLDAGRLGKHGLHIAVQAAPGLLESRCRVKAEFDLHPDIGQRHLGLGPGHLEARVVRGVVVVAPLMNTHLGGHQIGHGVGPAGDVFAMQKTVYGHRRLMPVRHRRDDVFWAKSRVASKKHLRQAGLKGGLVEHRQAPLVKLNTAAPLNPREGVLLAHCNQHCITRHQHVGLTGGDQAAFAFVVIHRLDHFKRHAGELAAAVFKRLGHMEVQDGNALMLRIFLLPGRGLHLIKATAHNHFHIGAAQAPCRAAAVHRGVATAQHNHPLADAGDMPKRHRSQPVDTDVDVFTDLLATRQLQVAAARRAAANKHRVISLGQQALHRLNALAAFELHPQVQDVAGFLIDHRLGQAKARDLRAYETARLGFAIKHRDFITQRRQISSHGQ